MNSKFTRSLKAFIPAKVAKIVPISLRNRLNDVLRKISPPATKRELTNDEIQYIRDELSDSMLELEKTFGFDVKKWGFGLR